MKQILPILLLSILLSSLSLNKPDIYWEGMNLFAAEEIIKTGVPGTDLFNKGPFLIHPPSTAYIIATGRFLFGESFWAARLPGLFIFLLTGVMLWTLITRLKYSSSTANVATLIYLTNPFALQGMLNLDFADGTLMPFCAVLFILVGILTEEKKDWVKTLALSFCICLLFWSKITTTIIFSIAYLLAAIISNKQDKKINLSLTVLSLGSIFFFISWVLYCLYVKSLFIPNTNSLKDIIYIPFKYLLSGGVASKAWELPIKSVILNNLRLLFYIGPMVIILAIPQIVNTINRTFKLQVSFYNLLILFFSLGVLLTYSLFLGGVGAFPKYYLPAVPFLAMYCAIFITKDEVSFSYNRKILLIFFSLFLLIYYIYFVGDNVYLLNYKLRIATYYGDVNDILKKITFGQIFYFLPFLFILILRFLFNKSYPIRSYIFYCLLFSQISLCLIQGLSNYSLRYLYGTPYGEIKKVQDTLLGLGVKSPIMANRMFTFHSNFKERFKYIGVDWGSLKNIKQTILKENPDAIVYGIPVNTVHQIKSIEGSKKIQNILNLKYNRLKTNLFWIWVKK